MKSSLLCILGLALMSPALHADVLGVYDFNDSFAPNGPSWVSPCIELGNFHPCPCIIETNFSSGGPDGSAFASFSGWDRTQFDASVYFDRSDTWQWPKTVGFTATAGATSLGFISGLSADLQRPNLNGPDTIMASIFWKDDMGNVQYRSSGPISLTDIGTWSTINFDMVNGTAGLPSGMDYSGENFLVELYAWGGNGGELYLDNVTLEGQCAPIPEPGGALLVACAGFVVMLRRRRR
jgi:hypothetical protein